eukprot:scaffold3768_cov376-Prasinococcus_capsulatus_cf.AAC.35
MAPAAAIAVAPFLGKTEQLRRRTPRNTARAYATRRLSTRAGLLTGLKGLFSRGGKGAYEVLQAEQDQIAGLPGDAKPAAKVELVDGSYYALKDPKDAKNPFEKFKLAKNPYFLFNKSNLKEFVGETFSTGDFVSFYDAADKDTKDSIDHRLKWLGLFHRPKTTKGRFMMRLRIPNGIVTSEQMEFLAATIEKYGDDGCADITTRQNIQIRGVTLDDAPEILDELENLGLTTKQSGMDNVRNCCGNPLAGLDKEEIIDTRPFNDILNKYITANGKGNGVVANLPRKFNVCVVGSNDLYEHPDINDFALIPAIKDGVVGFNADVGGFYSATRCELAVPLGAWVAKEDIAALLNAVLCTFRDFGSRGGRQKCRLMWLIDEMGMDKFREEVESRMPEKTLATAGTSLVDTSKPRREYYGVHEQKQEGLNYVGVNVPVGRMLAEDMFELARIAKEYGDGEIRLTVEQNVVFGNIPTEKIEAFKAEPLFEKFKINPGMLSMGLVSCTGNQFCGFSNIETKAQAKRVAEQLEQTLIFSKPIRMHWTGCTNTCGQVQLADIGLMGTKVKDASGEFVEAVDIFLGGAIGHEAAIGEVYKSNVECTKLIPVLEELMIEKFEATKK